MSKKYSDDSDLSSIIYKYKKNDSKKKSKKESKKQSRKKLYNSNFKRYWVVSSLN
jgi:hypothetical protein